MIRLERSAREDSRGWTLYVNGLRVLALNYWHIWRYQRRPLLGFLAQIRLPSRVARGSAAWRGLSPFRRFIHPPNWLRRTVYVGWRARGGSYLMHGHRAIRVGYAHEHAVPYSFR